jgi:RNA polymerase sigma-70 factor (ECF subfamily)
MSKEKPDSEMPPLNDEMLRPETLAQMEIAFRSYSEILYRFAQGRIQRLTRARFDASDVVQEVFLEALRRFERYRSGPQIPLKIWLLLLTRQKIAEMYRSARSGKRDPAKERWLDANGTDVDPTPLAESLINSTMSPRGKLIAQELLHTLVHQLNTLTPTDRELLCLKYLDGYSYEQVAILLNISVTSATSRTQKARHRLRKLMLRFL